MPSQPFSQPSTSRQTRSTSPSAKYTIVAFEPDADRSSLGCRAYFKDFLANFLSGGFDVLHGLANPGSGCFVATLSLGHVVSSRFHQSFQIFVFLHGLPDSSSVA